MGLANGVATWDPFFFFLVGAALAFAGIDATKGEALADAAGRSDSDSNSDLRFLRGRTVAAAAAAPAHQRLRDSCQIHTRYLAGHHRSPYLESIHMPARGVDCTFPSV